MLLLPLLTLLSLVIFIGASLFGDKEHVLHLLDLRSTRQELTDRLFNGYDYKKPPPDGTTVDISFDVQHVYFPDDDSPLAVMLCTVSYTWSDKRLMWNSADYEGIQKLTLPANHKLWKPQCMTNMDGRNHRIASTAKLLKGFELEVREKGRESPAFVSMYRRVELEAVCEKEKSFPTMLKCEFHARSKEDVSVAKWNFAAGKKLSGFMDDNTTGTGLYEIESIKGLSSTNIYNRRKENGFSVTVRLRGTTSLDAILATIFLIVLSALVLIAFMLPPSHHYLNSFVMILIFLLILIPSQLVVSIKSYSSFGVPSQTRVYAFLFAITTAILPLQNLLGSEIMKEKSHHLLAMAQRVPYFKDFSTKMFPYTKDFELPFIYVFIKTIIASIITAVLATLLII